METLNIINSQSILKDIVNKAQLLTNLKFNFKKGKIFKNNSASVDFYINPSMLHRLIVYVLDGNVFVSLISIDKDGNESTKQIEKIKELSNQLISESININ